VALWIVDYCRSCLVDVRLQLLMDRFIIVLLGRSHFGR